MTEDIRDFTAAKEAIREVLFRLSMKQVVHYGAAAWCAGQLRLWTTDDERRPGSGWNVLGPHHQHNPATGTIVTNRTVYLPEVYRG